MIDVDEFRRLFQAQVSLVAVITAQAGERRAGFTATAVCSLQDDPPSLIVSINRKTNAYPLIVESKRFAVNFLAADQEHVSARFAKHAADLDEAAMKFDAAGDWCLSAHGALLLQNATAVAECELVQSVELNTHAILIGNILDAEVSETAKPLLYGFKRYVRIPETREQHA